MLIRCPNITYYCFHIVLGKTTALNHFETFSSLFSALHSVFSVAFKSKLEKNLDLPNSSVLLLYPEPHFLNHISLIK